MCILCVNTSYAQFDKLTEAQELMKEKRYAQAIYILEGAKSHPETKDNSHTWYLRANSYYNYYKQVGDYTDKKIALLDTATSSALISNKLNPEDEIKLDNIKIVENVIKRYHNFYTILLRDSLNSTKSEKFYNKYKSTTLLIKPNFDFKSEDINYYNAVGSILVIYSLKHLMINMVMYQRLHYLRCFLWIPKILLQILIWEFIIIIKGLN